jgi:hypothetical protein
MRAVLDETFLWQSARQRQQTRTIIVYYISTIFKRLLLPLARMLYV